MNETRHVGLEGVTPLLMHRFPLEPIEALDKQPPDKQAEYAAYRDPDTNDLYVPAIAVQRALVAAAAYSKGKGRATLAKPAAACVLVWPERLSLGTQSFELDARAVVVPATRGRVVRYRPRFDKWKIDFTLEWDPTLITDTQMRRIVDDMGQRVGLLDFRPERKGPFGRSIVTDWS